MVNGSERVDPITVEVIRHRLLSAAKEMASNLMRTAYNTVVYEIRDFGLGIHDRDGRLIAEAPGLTIFTRANDFALRSVIEFLGYEGLSPGDAIILNYPYWSSAHTLDVAVCSPIFHGQEVVGFTAVRTHWLDLKQRDAGYCLDTRSMYEEGIFFPCSKVYRAGVLNEDIVNILRFNSREPERVIGDMFAQISACRIGERRTVEVIDRFGRATYERAIAQIQDHGEELALQTLRELPAGTWTAEDFVDGDGVDEKPVKMKVTVTVNAEEMVVDWTGSDPTTKGPINLPYGMTVGLSSLVFKAVTTPDTPATGGNFRPLKVIAPAGTMMHATPPAPTFTLWPSLLGCDVLLKAIAAGMPDRVPACSGGDVSSMLGLGFNPRTRRRWHEGLNEGVGFGGHSRGDGENGIMHMAEPGCRNLPVEVIETKAPITIESYGLRPDSGGPGFHRGGLGVSRTYRYLADSTVAMLVYKTRTRPWAVAEGETGENAHIIMNPGTPRETVGGGFYRQLPAGEVLVNNSGGGGGWGNPYARDPSAVLADVREGYVTREAALRDYGVVIESSGDAIDLDATAAKRTKPRPSPAEPVGASTVGRRPTVERIVEGHD